MAFQRQGGAAAAEGRRATRAVMRHMLSRLLLLALLMAAWSPEAVLQQALAAESPAVPAFSSAGSRSYGGKRMRMQHSRRQMQDASGGTFSAKPFLSVALASASKSWASARGLCCKDSFTDKTRQALAPYNRRR